MDIIIRIALLVLIIILFGIIYFQRYYYEHRIKQINYMSVQPFKSYSSMLVKHVKFSRYLYGLSKKLNKENRIVTLEVTRIYNEIHKDLEV